MKSNLKPGQWIFLVAFAFLARLANGAEGLVIEELQANKLVYRPTETGVIHVRIRNKSPGVTRGALELFVTTELVDRTALGDSEPVTLAGGEVKSFDIPFNSGKVGFGHELTAILRLATSLRGQFHEKKSGGVEDVAKDYFSVADNWFEVGIGPDWGAAIFTGGGKSSKIPPRARKLYCNMVEMGFWAPCDWSMLVSPTKRWWSGQASYPEDEDMLKALIKTCHEQGIKVCFYASGNPAGPFGWELARKHPDWFVKHPMGGFDGYYNVELLDRWNDEAWRTDSVSTSQKAQKLPWLVLRADFRRLDTLDWGVNQIVQSVKHYEWDAVRFDGHYSIAGLDDISTRNLRRLKERALESCPDFRLGFNYGRSPEGWSLKHELREAMAGGGLYLQEGIRNWRYSAQGQYKSWQHYATNELRSAKEIQAYGGSYYCVWGLNDGRVSSNQAPYKLVYGLIAGGHPYYGFSQTPGCNRWGAFLTRWSAFLWDINLRPAKGIKEMVTLKSSAPVYWKPLAQERVESAQRKYLVLHLVNPPPSDEIEKTTLPAPLDNLSLTLKPEAGTRVRNLLLVRPEAEPYGVGIQFRETNGVITATVPRLTCWAMVIVELEGKFTVPQAAPRFTEPADPVQVAAAEKSAGSSGNMVPNKPEEKTVLNSKQTIWRMGPAKQNVAVKDDEATDGVAQFCEMDKSTPLGKPYLGPFPPGRYRANFHLKCVAQEPSARFKLNASVVVGTKSSKAWKIFSTTIDDAELKSDRHYKDYPVDFEIISSTTEFVAVGAGFAVQKAGKDAVFLDYVSIEQLEQFPDRKVAELNEVEKPGNLRTPKGSKPEQVLLVKGLYWKQYQVDKALSCASTFELPAKYEDAYTNDAIVLCNMDFKFGAYPARQVLKDFVEDGGRLVILGGVNTLGCGAMPGTFLDEMFPFALTGPAEIVSATPPLILGSKSDVPYADHPAVFWRHKISLRPGAEVLGFAGPNPIAARRTVGKGSVVVFAGTVLGESTTQARAFWECDSWAELLKRMIQQ